MTTVEETYTYEIEDILDWTIRGNVRDALIEDAWRQFERDHGDLAYSHTADHTTYAHKGTFYIECSAEAPEDEEEDEDA